MIGDKLLEYFFLAYEERLGLLSADQSTMEWLGTYGQELTMVQKGCVARLARYV